MFTGLIREIGVVNGVKPRRGVLELSVTAPRTAAAAQIGDSIAVQGVCLTVTGVRGDVFTVEAAAETRRLTTLGRWRRGRRVHLEPALRAGDPLDGHLVQGHVDGTGRVLTLRRAPAGGLLLTVGLAPELASLLTPKGSVALDGVSLTVDAGPHRDRFTVNLIPHTLDETNLGALRAGDAVTLEMDVLVKAARSGSWSGWPSVEDAGAGGQADAAPQRRLTVQKLRELGFGRPRRKGTA